MYRPFQLSEAEQVLKWPVYIIFKVSPVRFFLKSFVGFKTVIAAAFRTVTSGQCIYEKGVSKKSGEKFCRAYETY